jgi:hypothetical protein
MAGRLIILRHKTWHVWNRENIEKVKKDERLHREEMEAKREKERKLHSEQILESFQQQQSNEEEGIGESQQRNQLLSLDRSVENEEYKKEKEEKELLAKRREGSAPWALGEGSSEFKKVKPWYLTQEKEKVEKKIVRIGGRVLSGEDAQAAMDRDQVRKRSEDPMGMYLYSTLVQEREEEEEKKQQKRKSGDQIVLFDPNKKPKPTETKTTALPGMSGFNSFVLGMRGEGGVMTTTSDASLGGDVEKRKRKQSKDAKKEKKRRREKGGEKKMKKKKGKKRRSSQGESEESDSSLSEREQHQHSHRHGAEERVTHHSLSREEMELLRQRRTERERTERLREGRLRESESLL